MRCQYESGKVVIVSCMWKQNEIGSLFEKKYRVFMYLNHLEENGL